MLSCSRIAYENTKKSPFSSIVFYFTLLVGYDNAHRTPMSSFIGRERRKFMNWQFLATFGIGLGIYFVGLAIVVLIKRHRNKKAFDKETKEVSDKDKDGERKN